MKRLLVIGAAIAALMSAPAEGQRSQNIAKGFAADKVFEFNDVDHINTFNGSLNVVLPLGQKYQVSAGLSYQFVLAYSGNNWETGQTIEEHLDPEGVPVQEFHDYTYPAGTWDQYPPRSAGLGWRLSFGELSDMEQVIDSPVYRGPDGSEHRFHPRLHHDDFGVNPPPADPDPGVSYTNDGSYLRMRSYSDNGVSVADVEFPDGSVHQFKASDGSLRHMRDAYNNRVTFSETTAGNTITRTMADGFRTHTMTFERVTAMSPPGTFDLTVFDVLKTLDVAAFNGRARYLFYYRDMGLSVLSRKVGNNQQCAISPQSQAPILDHIDLDSGPGTPARSLYRFAYDLGDNFWDSSVANGTSYSNSGQPGGTFTAGAGGCTGRRGGFSGNLTSLTLPTLGTINWKYAEYHYPASSIESCVSGTGEPGPCGGSAIVHSIGVKERTELDPLGKYLSKRVYTSDLYHDGPIKTASHTLLTTIDTYAGMDTTHPGTVFSKQLSFYSAGATDNSSTGTKGGEYGAPFTRRTTDATFTRGIANPDPLDANRFLSTAIADGNGNVKRYSYVRYEADDLDMRAREQSNRRVRSERTVYADDADRYASTDSSDYDGLGHYRTVTTGGNFPGANVRTATTAYNRRDSAVDSAAYDSGSYNPASPDTGFTLPPVNEPWVIGTYSSQSTTEGASTIRSLACFDRSKGFLKRQRLFKNGTGAGGNDVLLQYTAYGNGNLLSEESYGGDTDALNLTTTQLCGTGINNVFRYWTVHDYASGSLSRSRYRDPLTGLDLPFNTADATIEPNTGLPSSSRDSAGATTTYTYDNAARVRTITTPDGLTTTYTYNDAAISGSVFTPASVLADSNTVAGLGAIRAAYEYDAIGRVHREKRLLEADWVYRDTEYDDRGFRTSTSVWTKAPLSGPYPVPANVTTFTDYDVFGRATRVVAPDQTTSVVAFGGTRSVTRFANVALVGGFDTAATWEFYDRFGRLAEIQEASGPSGSINQTLYGYDAAGRLTSAVTIAPELTQTRSFTYDGRGFLTDETHPETGTNGNGAIHYQYDPRGHVTRKYIGSGNDSFDLEFTYDFAERLTLAKQRVGGTSIKAWNYNDCTQNNVAADCDGRLQSATRYNTDAVLGTVPVTDAYQYTPTGHVSGRTTTVGTTSSLQGLTVQLDQGWNAFGLPSTQSYPQCLSPAGCQAQSLSRTLAYGYTNGLLTSIPTWVSAIRYEPNGTVRAVEHSNGLNEVWVPDPKGMARPCRISAYWSFSTLNQNPGDECGWSEPTTPVWTTGRYQYDGSGNIKQIGTTAYRYDAVNRLREVTPAGANTESYTYDSFGNRTTPAATTQPCTFNANHTFVCTTPSFLQLNAYPATNRVKTWTYDAAGNATGDGIGSFTWDGAGTMRTSLRAGRELHFLYNADDERIALVERISGHNKSTFTLRGLGNELLRTLVDDETTGIQQWSWKEDEIWRGGTLLANVNGAGAKHLVLDHLGSPRAISTVSTAAISVQNFSPFGMGGVAGSGSLMFTAHERDSATVGDSVVGQPDYLHARYYGPSTGRFLSLDPIMNVSNAIMVPQTWNRYSYVANNPINLTDTTGRLIDWNRIMQDVASIFGASWATDSNARVKYNNAKADLKQGEPGAPKARTAFKQAARSESTPAAAKVAETMRPMAEEGARLGGTVAKGNAAVDVVFASRAGRAAGPVLLLASVACSAVTIANAPEGQRFRTLAGESGALLGSLSFGIAGGLGGATAGAAVGNVPGSIVGGLGGMTLGGVVGGQLGEQAGHNLYDMFVTEHP